MFVPVAQLAVSDVLNVMKHGLFVPDARQQTSFAQATNHNDRLYKITLKRYST